MTATASDYTTTKVNHTNDQEAPKTVGEVLQTNAFFGGHHTDNDNSKDRQHHHETELPLEKDDEPFTLDSKNPTVGEVLQSNAFFRGSDSDKQEHAAADDEKHRQHHEPPAPPKEGEPFKLDSKNPTVGEVLQSNVFSREGSDEKQEETKDKLA